MEWKNIHQTMRIQIILLFFMNNKQKKIMNSQDNSIEQFFKPFDVSQFQKLQKQQVINKLEVSLKKSKNHTHWLFMTKKYIFLTQKESLDKLSQVYAVELDFQIKFQAVLSPNSTHLDKIGIRFAKDKKQCVFYTFDQYNLSLFEEALPQYINQMSFHEVYSPLEKLGRGHFAHVYHVARIRDRQQFAVKAFSKENIYSVSTGKQSLKNEIKIMRETSNISKNLLNLYQVYQTEKSIYVVLELLKGKNFGKVMQQRPAGLKYPEVKVLLKGLLHGIKCLHQKKIMHRDLKPENIVFRTQNLLESPENFDPVIVDFGMATHYDIQSYIFYRCGTAGFIAPQIINLTVEGPYSPVCDIFSIGCLFHLMMTGNSIFGSTHDDQLLLEKNKNLQFDIYTDRVQNCHPFAMDLLKRLVQKTPNKRISIQQALNHSFFNEKHLESPQFLSRKNSVFNFFGLFSD